MKYFITILSIFFSISLVAQKIPEISKTEFSKEALSEQVLDVNDNKITLNTLLENYKGKIIVIKFWAGWCKDCLVDMPFSDQLKENNPEVSFIYLSLDRNKEFWLKSIVKYGLDKKGNNYWFYTGWKNTFTEYIELNWIPRYMIIAPDGKIAKYYSVTAKDPEIQEIIENLRNENQK
ncbi:thioredoxin-like domain-containing protein [Apibacter raozihei]|uniref:TlpA family protein disulfide reductase n=1 Tax=Apibacter raozihei TaxID=2500547 RepID=UPI000FE2CA7D|nr:thioredoxin-like domain-containing protein [Apibacter raozihei]